MTYNIKIIGRGKYLPSRKIDSYQLEKQLALDKGYIEEKFGVKQRYWVNEKESNSYMGARALEKALENAGLEFEELDLLLSASATYDYPLPSSASFIQREMGKSDSGVPAFDVNSSCLSFLSALEVASHLIHVGTYKKIAIVSSEIASKSLNVNDIETYSLFGDGAVAYIFSESDGKSYCRNFKSNTYSEGAFYTSVKGGGNVMHHHNPHADKHADDYYFQMEGSKVLKFTIRKLDEFLNKYASETGKNINEYQHIIPHQASKFGLQFLTKYYDINPDNIHFTLEKYGNIIAASIPVTLYDAIEEKKIKRGDEILLLGTAAGITIGTAMLKY